MTYQNKSERVSVSEAMRLAINYIKTKQDQNIMKKPTPSDIKYSEVLGEYFFTRSSMRFFGQTMSDFKTEWSDKEKAIIRIYAPSRMDGRIIGETERFIDVSSEAWKEVE